MQTITIQDDKVTLSKSIVTREVSLQEFLSELTSNVPMRTEILPQGIKCLSSNERSSAFVVECPAGRKAVSWEPGEKRRGHIMLNLYFPWTYFFILCQTKPIAVHHVGVGFSEKPINDMSDTIGQMTIPNTHYHGEENINSFCLGDINIEDNLHFSKGINQLVSEMFASQYNHDLSFWDEGICKKIKEMLEAQDFLESIQKDFNALKESTDEDEMMTRHFLQNILSDDRRMAWDSYLYCWDQITKKHTDRELVKLIIPEQQVPFFAMFNNFNRELERM